MKYREKLFLTASIAATLLGVVPTVHAAYDENLNVYTLDTVVVEAEKTKNKFGDTITEQSTIVPAATSKSSPEKKSKSVITPMLRKLLNVFLALLSRTRATVVVNMATSSTTMVYPSMAIPESSYWSMAVV